MVNLLKKGITRFSWHLFDQPLNRETPDKDIKILSIILGVNIIIWRRTTENITSQGSDNNQYNKLLYTNKHKLLPSFHFLESEPNVYILYKKKSVLFFDPNLLKKLKVKDALYGNVIPEYIIDYYTVPMLNLREAIKGAISRPPSNRNPSPLEEEKGPNLVLDPPEEGPIEMEYMHEQFENSDADPNH